MDTSNISGLIETMNRFLDYQMSSSSADVWTFLSTVVAPIISAFAIITGGAFALYKYHSLKHHAINLKILHEVYVPLYAYIVRQETFRDIAPRDEELSHAENPIIEIKSASTKQKISSPGISFKTDANAACGCISSSFIEISEKTNFGLASTELVTLINMYKILVCCTGGDQITKEKARAILMRRKVEHALVQEILKGYNYYHKKLKLPKGHSDIFTVTDHQFNIKTFFAQDEIEKMMASPRDRQGVS